MRGGAWYWDDEELETRGLATDPGSAGLLEDELRSALAERGWTMEWTSDGLEFRLALRCASDMDRREPLDLPHHRLETL